MKNSFLFSLLMALSPMVSAQFRYEPAAPQPNSVVSFTYSPADTPLAADSLLEARYIRYGAPQAMSSLAQLATIKLRRDGRDFTGKVFVPEKEVAGLMLLFRPIGQPKRADLNNGNLYAIPVCDEKSCPVPHALAGQASVFMRSNLLYEAGSQPNYARVLQLYDMEMGEHPDLRPTYWADYLSAIIKQRKPGYGPYVKKEIEKYLASQKTPTPADWAAAAQLYENVGDLPRANAMRERQKVAEPTGTLSQKSRADAIRNQADWNRKKALYAAYIRDFPKAQYVPQLSVLMTDGFYRQNDIRGMMTLLDTLPPTQTDPMMLGNIAFLLADENRNLNDAERLVLRALKDFDVQPKPFRTPAAQWSAEQAIRRRQLLNAYARTLEQQQKWPDAYKTYQEILLPDSIDSSDPRTNERFFTAALRTNHSAEAKKWAEAAIHAGRATPELRTAFRDWYAKQPGQTTGSAATHLSNLEADLRDDFRESLREQFINEPAPNFSLTDLQGRTISLAALRGKVVVLDFWATWCGPCVASFPAMQRAQQRFEDDDDVQFLFVNTREGGPLSRVHAFMNKRPTYQFIVPLDTQQRVANAYKVQGIPTKVVIDGQGRIRFRQIGYNGDPEETVNEISTVVEMLREQP